MFADSGYRGVEKREENQARLPGVNWHISPKYSSRLQQFQQQYLKRDELLMKVGAARHDAGRAASLIKLKLAGKNADGTVCLALELKLDRDKLRQVRRHEGCYLLRTNLCDHDPAQLWSFYTQLTEVEQALKELKHDLAIRPIFHRTEQRVQAHIFVAFLAYCLQVTLKARLRPLAKGLTPAEVIAKFKTMQMIDVYVPTTDGRELILPRYTQPEAEHHMLLDQLGLKLPQQPPPKISAKQLQRTAEVNTL